MFHPYHAKHKFRMKWWPIQCEQHCHSSCVLSSYSNTLPSSTLTTAAPSQQMTCLKKTPSNKSSFYACNSAKPWSTWQALKYKSVKPWSTWQALDTIQPNQEVPDRHSIQTMKSLTDTHKPWSTWQTLTNHEVPDRHSIQTMKYPTDTQYKPAKPWSTWQVLKTVQPNHEVPDRHSVQNYKSYHPKITGDLARGLVSPDQFRLPYNTTKLKRFVFRLMHARWGQSCSQCRSWLPHFPCRLH